MDDLSIGGGESKRKRIFYFFNKMALAFLLLFVIPPSPNFLVRARMCVCVCGECEKSKAPREKLGGKGRVRRRSSPAEERLGGLLARQPWLRIEGLEIGIDRNRGPCKQHTLLPFELLEGPPSMPDAKMKLAGPCSCA